MREYYCGRCGAEVSARSQSCPSCGAGRFARYQERRELSEKSFIATLVLCFFLGYLGIHRFYNGKVITGLLMLLTFGGFGIWWFLDFFYILFGGFRDNEGRALVR